MPLKGNHREAKLYTLVTPENVMKNDVLFRKALNLEPLTIDEGLWLYDKASLAELMFIGMELRKKQVPGNEVGWILDRNVNITNVCFSQCLFCNFCRKKGAPDSYVTTIDEYREKCSVLFDLGGDQLLLQGGMHPDLGLGFYTDLFGTLKQEFPELRLHALGPPEVIWLARKEKITVREVLETLRKAGLDSLPGAGAEILSDRVRKIVSAAKATTHEWLGVMKEAHLMNLPTSATMMFGHAETARERIEHLVLLRELQSQKPEGHYGFIAFIPWPFQDEGTRLASEQGIKNSVSAEGYLRLIAISRIMGIGKLLLPLQYKAQTVMPVSLLFIDCQSFFVTTFGLSPFIATVMRHAQAVI